MSERPDELTAAPPAPAPEGASAAPATAPAPQGTSLRAALEAGFAADAAKSGQAAPEIKAATIPDPAAPPAATQPRGEDGKFAPKTTDGEAAKPVASEIKTPDSAKAAAPEAPSEPIRPPAALSAGAKAKWATLDPVLQAEWSKRETDMVQGNQKQADQLKRFERMDEAIAPHRNYLAMNGLDEPTYVRSLIAADEQLRGPNPLGALAQIAGMYNIDLRQLGQPAPAGQPGQQPAPPQAQPDPRYQALEQKFAELSQTVAQQQSAAQQTDQSRIQAQIDAFGQDNVYFENVRQPMAALLRSPTLAAMADVNPAEAMKIAYDQACWASPEVRPLLLKEQADKQAAAERAAASAKAEEARRASGSITGSPTPGATPVRSGPPPSIRESLERQFDAALT